MVYNLAIFLAYFALFLQFSPVASPLAGLHPMAAVFALGTRTPDQSAHIKHHIGHVTSYSVLPKQRLHITHALHVSHGARHAEHVAEEQEGYAETSTQSA